MAQVEKLLIFLASPSDVPTERRYVDEIINELNHTVAPSKNVILQVVRWENDAFPGYGMDAQALINAQIAEMTKYALFVGIMWNRLGTPTPRAASGTVEEFERAVEAYRQIGHPDIWFYFRDSASKFQTEEQLEQLRQVLTFKKRVQSGGMPWTYKNPIDFREKFRNQMILWLNTWTPKITQELTSNSSNIGENTTGETPLIKSSPEKNDNESPGELGKNSDTQLNAKHSPVSNIITYTFIILVLGILSYLIITTGLIDKLIFPATSSPDTTLKITDTINVTRPELVTSPENINYDNILNSKLNLSETGKEAFIKGQYEWSVKFLTQAKSVETSEIWQLNYPFLIGSLLKLKREKEAITLFDELEGKVGKGYLSSKQTLESLIANLKQVKAQMLSDYHPHFDNVIEKAREKITPPPPQTFSITLELNADMSDAIAQIDGQTVPMGGNSLIKTLTAYKKDKPQVLKLISNFGTCEGVINNETRVINQSNLQCN